MKKYIAIAALSGAISVGLGAFGAHGLKMILSETALQSFETGVRYQLLHTLLLLIVVVIPILKEQQKTRIARVLLAGIVCFSGSIYLLALDLVPVKFLWFVTPLGGLFLLAAWCMLGVYSLIQKNDP